MVLIWCVIMILLYFASVGFYITTIDLLSCILNVLIVCYRVFVLKLHYLLITIQVIKSGMWVCHMYSSSDVKSSRMANLRAAASCTHCPSITKPVFKGSIDVKTWHRNCCFLDTMLWWNGTDKPGNWFYSQSKKNPTVHWAQLQLVFKQYYFDNELALA